jgi:hypothetical protein
LFVSVDAGVLSANQNPMCDSSHSSIGLTIEEILEMAFIAGSHPNVRLRRTIFSANQCEILC